MATTIHKLISQEIERLSDQQLHEVLMFIEFINMREDKNFIGYVNRRTQQALDMRQRGIKFHSLDELQKEFNKA
ncbi:MAG: hypothetical protein AAB116_00700 [Candidatus Poribacteria bacterium]